MYKIYVFEPERDKTVPQAKTQISLDTHTAWSESSLSARAEVAIHNAYNKTSDQNWWTTRLIWVLARRTDHFCRAPAQTLKTVEEELIAIIASVKTQTSEESTCSEKLFDNTKHNTHYTKWDGMKTETKLKKISRECSNQRSQPSGIKSRKRETTTCEHTRRHVGGSGHYINCNTNRKY